MNVFQRNTGGSEGYSKQQENRLSEASRPRQQGRKKNRTKEILEAGRCVHKINQVS